MLEFDDEASRRLEEAYRSPDLVEQRRITVQALRPAPGEKVLDIGAGPGLLAAEIAEVVGPGGAVHGVDVSESMLALAARRPVEMHLADACALPFEADSFDAVVSTQVYEYVADMPTALAEAHRVLRPGGRLFVLDTHWDSLVWHARDAGRARRVLDAWAEHLAHPDLPQRLNGLLDDAGFTVRERSSYAMLNAGWEDGMFSAGLMGVVAAYVPGHRGVTEEEAAAWAEELRGLGRDYFFSLNRYLFLATA